MCVLKNSTNCMEYKKKDLLLSTGNSESYMNGQYVAWIESSLLFGSNDRMSGLLITYFVYFRTCLVQFVYGIVVPLILPEFSEVIVQTWFQIREKDVFV